MFNWPPLLKAVIFCTNEEEWRISGHLSAAAKINGTLHFRQYTEARDGATARNSRAGGELHNEELHNLYFTRILLK
jgi:hypothetical protein